MCCLSIWLVACNNDDKDVLSSIDENSVSENAAENGYKWVDLGLPSGTRWATCNIGAEKPQDYGNYYAWGEVIQKSFYSWSTYKYGSDYDQLTKYCNKSEYGVNDNKTVLELEDDAAYMNWGGKWRMPTDEQQTELRKQCYWVWTESYNGVKGYIVYKAKTSSDKGVYVYEGENQSSYTISDVHIFLPAAGHRDSYGFDGAGFGGSYWSSSLSVSRPGRACIVSLEPTSVVGSYSTSRSNGSSVRAVIPGE